MFGPGGTGFATLSADDLFQVFARLNRDNGWNAVVNPGPGALRQVVIEVAQRAWDEELDVNDVFAAAAHGVRAIIDRRPFSAFNATVAVAAAELFLDRNGFEVMAQADRLVNELVDPNGVSVEHIAKLLRANSQPISVPG